jgi:uncharacterized protein YceK
MRLQVTYLSFLAAAALFLAGCASVRGADDPFAQKAGAEEVKVSITNLAFSDATVWGVTNGGRHRLGTVTGKRETAFYLPISYASEFYLEIDLLAGPRCRTESMMVAPGDHVELTIQGNIQNGLCGVP